MAGGEHYRKYARREITLYYIISKTNPDDQEFGKMGVAVYPPHLDSKVECFNAQDKPMGFDKILKITGLDENLFKSNPNELSVYEKLNLDESKITHNSDGSIDYNGDVDLRELNLTEIPFKFRMVRGHFSCSHNQLTTLENCPEEVGGGFWCDNNKLATLKGSPREVGGDFSCTNNQLTTLKGSPREVGGHFSCSANKLTTLKDAPQKVGGYFRCMNTTPPLPQSEIDWAEQNIKARLFVW